MKVWVVYLSLKDSSLNKKFICPSTRTPDHVLFTHINLQTKYKPFSLSVRTCIYVLYVNKNIPN